MQVRKQQLELNMGQQTGSKYEKNIITNIPSDVIEKIATVYNTSPSYIFGWNESNNQQSCNQSAVRRSITDREIDLILLYRAADCDIRTAVDNVLGLNKKKKRDIG